MKVLAASAVALAVSFFGSVSFANPIPCAGCELPNVRAEESAAVDAIPTTDCAGCEPPNATARDILELSTTVVLVESTFPAVASSPSTLNEDCPGCELIKTEVYNAIRAAATQADDAVTSPAPCPGCELP